MYDFSQPCLLLLCIIPLLVYRWCRPIEVKYQSALRVPFFEKWLSQDSIHQHTSNIPWFWHWVGVWILFVFALAGPRWVGEPIAIHYDTHHVMLVLDISGSMALEDMPSHHGYQTRWEVVRKTALDFVRHRNQDKTGLILFGEQAYLFAPLTLDKFTLRERILDAAVGMAGQATALGDAIGLGVKHLQNTPMTGRVMVLLTDGVANAGILAADKAAEIAKKENIKIYAIGLGPNTKGHSLSQIFWNMQSSSDLDEGTLKAISKKTNGQYFRATDEKSLEKIYQHIDKLEAVKQARQDLRPEKQYFYIPLSVGFFWLMILFFLRIWRDKSWQ